jgi:hypothetical protein
MIAIHGFANTPKMSKEDWAKERIDKMLMRFSDMLLLEGTIEYLKANSGLPHDHIDRLADFDPSPKKKYLGWIVKHHKKVGERLKDGFLHPDVHDLAKQQHREALGHFDNQAVKNRLDRKDINLYSNLGDLQRSVAPHVDALSKTKEKKKALEGSQKIFEKPGLKGYKVTTREAAILHGKGTQWCTASTESANHADSYLKGGPLYVFHDTDSEGAPTGKKHQLYFHPHHRVELQNERRQNVNVDDFVAKHPELADHPEFKGKSEHFMNRTEKANALAHSPDENKRIDAIQKYGAHRMEGNEHLWDDTILVQHAIVKAAHSSGDKKEIARAHEAFHTSPSPHVRAEIAKKASQKTLVKMALASSPLVKQGIRDTPNDELHDTILKRGKKDVHIAAAKSGDPILRARAVLQSPHQQEVHSAYLENIGSKSSSYRRKNQEDGNEISVSGGGGVENPEEHIALQGHKPHLDQLVDHPNPWVRVAVMRHGHPEHLDHGVHDSSVYVRGEVAKHRSHAHLLANDRDPYVRENARGAR